MKRLCDAVRERACAALQCAEDELLVRPTPEGLIELRMVCIYVTRGLSSATLVGTAEQLDLWLSRKVHDLGSDVPLNRSPIS